MQDQLIIYMALAGGTSRMLCASPSLHTQTAMVIAEQLLPAAKFRVVEQAPTGTSGGAALALVECHGAAVVPSPV